MEQKVTGRNIKNLVTYQGIKSVEVDLETLTRKTVAWIILRLQQSHERITMLKT